MKKLGLKKSDLKESDARYCSRHLSVYPFWEECPECELDRKEEQIYQIYSEAWVDKDEDEDE